MSPLTYQNIFFLLRLADSIDIERPIPREILDDYMKKREQKKPSCKPISHPTKYLDYIHCDPDGPYFITRKGDHFFLILRDCVIGKYYAEPKNETFDIF